MKQLYLERQKQYKNYSTQVKNKLKSTNYKWVDYRNCTQDTLCECFSGINVNIVDSKNLTALDTVRDMPSKNSRQIASLIQGTSGPDITHITESPQVIVFTLVFSLSKAHMCGRPSDTSLPPPPVPPPQESMSPKRKGQKHSKLYSMKLKIFGAF